VFGDSLCVPYNLPADSPAWPNLLADRLGYQCYNHARAAVDNLYIYAAFNEQLDAIRPNDMVIVSWTHPSRHLWILDQQNLEHQQAITDSIHYQLGQHTWFRAPPRQLPKNRFLKLQPENSGNEFFDHWFENHYNIYQQQLIFRAARHSVSYTCPAQLYYNFFSEESVTSESVQALGYTLDFINQNQLWISNEDYHFSCQGHQVWAEYLFAQISSNTN
jgi:hypothetical protein